MSEFFTLQLEYLLRLLIAALCGLTIGSGLYFIGLSATIIVIIGQIFLHRNIKWVLCYSKAEILSLIIDENTLSINEIKKIITNQNISIVKIKLTTYIKKEFS